MKILLSDSQIQYINWIENAEVTYNIEEADLVLFTGGEDVSPSLYDEPEHLTTWANIDRDEKEVFLFHQASLLGKKMLGICRGLSN